MTYRYRYHATDGSTSDYADSEGAMRAYAAGGFSGRIERVDDSPTPAPVATPTPDPVQEPGKARRLAYAASADFAQVETHADDVASAEDDTAWLRSMGLAPERARFSPGTPLNSFGIAKWRRERQAIEDMAPLAPQCDAIIEAVRKENRKDFLVDVSDLRMKVDPGGLLKLYRQSTGNGGLSIERNGIEALSARTDQRILPPLSFLRSMLAPEIADLWNARAPRLGQGDTVLVRARNGEGPASLYAVVSPKYGAFDVDRVAAAIKAEAGDLQGSLVYDSPAVGLDLEATIVSDVPPVVEEVWKVAITGTTKDDGTGAIDFGSAYYRVLCRNLTYETLTAAGYRRVHRGAMLGVGSRIRDAIGAANAGFARFAEKWGYLARTPAVQAFAVETMEDAIAKAVDTYLGDIAGLRRDIAVAAILNGLRKEQDQESAAALVNAVTRFHEERIPVPVLRQVEQAAGRMVAQLAAD